MKLQTVEFCNECRYFNSISGFCERVKIHPKANYVDGKYWYVIHRRCPLPNLEDYKCLDRLKKKMKTEIDK